MAKPKRDLLALARRKLFVSVVSDTRNDRLAPTAGHQIGASLEGAGIGGFSRFARLEARAIYFLGAPSWLLARSSFVAAVRAGWAFPFNQIGDFDTFAGPRGRLSAGT